MPSILVIKRPRAGDTDFRRQMTLGSRRRGLQSGGQKCGSSVGVA